MSMNNDHVCLLRELNMGPKADNRNWPLVSLNELPPLPFEQLKSFEQKDYERLIPYYKKYASDVHDLTLTNLMMWRHKHDLHTLELGGYLFFAYTPRDYSNCSFSEPIGFTTVKPIGYATAEPLGSYGAEQDQALKEALDLWLNLCTENGIVPKFRHVSTEFKTRLSTLGYDFIEIDLVDDYDYCYLTEDLARLSGNRYHKKKNHLNQFYKAYADRYNIVAIDEYHAQFAYIALQRWCQSNGCGADLDLCYEYHAIKEILTDWPMQQSRGLKGSLIYIDEQPVALTFGEQISEETFLVHIEKALPDYSGLYAAINHAMANQVLGQALYLNREQDLGIEGLRKAKRSYLPHHMVPKFNLTLKSHG